MNMYIGDIGVEKTNELVIANKEPVFQNKDKEKYKAALITNALTGTNENNREEKYIRHLAAIVASSDDAIISKPLDETVKSWNKGNTR